MNFYEKLEHAWETSGSLVCVGLDPDLAKLPSHLKTQSHPIFEFNRQIIDATSDLVCAYKPQIAYYAAQKAEDQLEMTLQYLQAKCPNAVVILDAKRGDIDSTAEMYAREAFDRYQVDAVTINPYMGEDTLQPFLKRTEKGTILLCKTSNPGSKTIQDLQVGEKKLFHYVAEQAAKKWNTNKNIALVIGATYPKELKEVRELTGDIPFLIPGVGAQGGDVKEILANGLSSQSAGLIINSARGIIYASNGTDFATAARKATQKLKDEINAHRK